MFAAKQFMQNSEDLDQDSLNYVVPSRRKHDSNMFGTFPYNLNTTEEPINLTRIPDGAGHYQEAQRLLNRQQRTHTKFRPLTPNLNVSQLHPKVLNDIKAKQGEVLEAAKCLFYKRTRTLFQWMYPKAAKHHMNNAIAEAWRTLSDEDRADFISQVLGRFGTPKSKLMVNPLINIANKFPPSIHAILEQTGPAPKLLSDASQNPGQSHLVIRQPSRVKKIRSRNKIRFDVVQDFHDDPELNNELVKFANKFNLSKIDRIRD